MGCVCSSGATSDTLSTNAKYSHYDKKRLREQLDGTFDFVKDWPTPLTDIVVEYSRTCYATREDFKKREEYVDYMAQTLHPGTSARTAQQFPRHRCNSRSAGMRVELLRSVGGRKQGDHGYFMGVNQSFPPCAIAWTEETGIV